MHLISGHHSELLLLSRRVLAEDIKAWIKEGFSTWALAVFFSTSRSFHHRITAAVAVRNSQFFPSALCNAIPNQSLCHYEASTVPVKFNVERQSQHFLILHGTTSPTLHWNKAKPFIFVWLLSKLWLREWLGSYKLIQVVPQIPVLNLDYFCEIKKEELCTCKSQPVNCVNGISIPAALPFKYKTLQKIMLPPSKFRGSSL